jgi:hypothetical protein
MLSEQGDFGDHYKGKAHRAHSQNHEELGQVSLLPATFESHTHQRDNQAGNPESLKSLTSKPS